MSSYEEMSNIAKRLNELCKPVIESMQYVNIDAFQSASKALAQSASAIVALQQPVMSESLLVAVNNARLIMSSTVLDSVNISMSESMQSLLEAIRPSIEMINANSALFRENYADMLKGFNDLGYDISSLAEQAYEQYENETAVDEFSSNEEIVEALEEQSCDPKGFQERIAEWSEKKKKKFFIIVTIICFIWTNVFAPYFQDNIGKPVTAIVIAKVRELPETVSRIIGEITEGFHGTITEDVPYYYKVTYIDENGETKEGYVAKKNLMIIEKEESERSIGQEE